MRKQAKKSRGKANHRRLSLTLIAAIALLAIAAVTVASRQKLSSDGGKPVTQAAHHENHLEAQSGQMQELDTQRTEKLAGGLKQLINHDSEDLVEVQHADGTVSINLEDHFQNVTVAKVNQNGNLSQSCVNDPQSAGAFFGIDPKLIDNKTRASAPVRKED